MKKQIAMLLMGMSLVGCVEYHEYAPPSPPVTVTHHHPVKSSGAYYGSTRPATPTPPVSVTTAPSSGGAYYGN